MAKDSETVDGAKKRTRSCPAYKEMYEQSQLDTNVLKAEVSYLSAKLETEMNYSRNLTELLRKKKGGGS